MPQKTDRAGAHVEHSSPGRTRYRVVGQRGNVGYFEGVAATLGAHSTVRQVLCNPGTGSILVHHDAATSAERLFTLAEEEGWFAPASPRQFTLRFGTPIEELRKLYERLEAAALRATRGGLDVESIAFVILVLSALAGMARGDVALRSGSAIWYALELIRKPSRAERRRTANKHPDTSDPDANPG